jgi:hypothetical protein
VLGKREYDCFGVLCGSTSNVRDLAYHKDPTAQAGSYPNLNNNVYCEYHLSPIRDREELRSIMPPGTSHEQVDACLELAAPSRDSSPIRRRTRWPTRISTRSSRGVRPSSR